MKDHTLQYVHNCYNVSNVQSIIYILKGTLMEKELGVTEARKEFSDLVERVQHRGDAYIINRHGKPAAAVVPVQVYENWRQQRRELFQLIRELQNEADLDPEDADLLAAEALAEVRR
ncbi:MAG: type II toxin-antitoxin system Phd/YefM family antitoxin [Anaerolineales bacterium]